MVVGDGFVRAGRKLSVLVIDDEQDICEYLGDFFTLEGFEVATLSDPTRAIERIVGDVFDLIMLDVCMPKIDGIELLTQIRAVDADISVILMCSAWPVRDVNSAANACITHPLTTSELREVIAQVMARPPRRPRRRSK